MFVDDKKSFLSANEYTWCATKEGVRYYATLQGTKLITLTDSGHKHSSGAGTLLAVDFLEKKKQQEYFKEIYGAAIYKDIFKAVLQEYRLYLSDPVAYDLKNSGRPSEQSGADHSLS